MRHIFLLPILLSVFAPSASGNGGPSAPPARSPERQPAAAQGQPRTPAPAPAASLLDTAKVRKLYQDGDFDQAIAILESALKDKRVADHSDSVFVFKHLGVMYAANETTRERGKYFMMQLLTIEPTARIMDMYASDMIYMIFKNIQEEYAASHAKYARAQGLMEDNRKDEPKPPGPARPEREPAPRASRAAYYWIGATCVAVGIGVAAYIVAGEKKTHTTNYPIE
jgi:hypothetical protein